MTSENTAMYMPVGPVGYNGGNGDGMFGGGWMWFLLVWMAMFGWGNNGWGNNGMNGGVGSEMQRGFDQAALTNGINGLQNTVQNGFAQAEISANSRQMADMNQNFALQTSISDLKYTIAAEACATRTANAANTQMVMDKLCQLELDGYKQRLDTANDTIGQLRTQLQVAANNASQNAQTAAILANNEAQTAALERYLAPNPIPAYIVQNPNCCQQNWGCGCGGM